MSASNVPKNDWTLTGVVPPSASLVLNGIILDIDNAFGGGLNPSLETPQGQLASSFAAVVDDKNIEMVQMPNNIDPLTASGQWQDAIGRFYFLDRIAAASTVVTATITGVYGTVLAAGTLARDTNDNSYFSTGIITIPASGVVDAQFSNIKTGAIACPAGTLTGVGQSIVGWDAITNAADGTLGRDVESRAEFEYRRKNSVALNARGSIQAIYSNVFLVDGVLDVYVTDNVTNATVNTGASNYPLVAHSVFVSVVGGLDADIAKSIWLSKDLGCDYNGNTTVSVIDDSGYNYPYPIYSVKFERPASLPIKYAVQIVNSPSLPNDIVTQIKNAIIAKFNGTDGGQRERIGAAIYSSNYYATVALLSASISVLSILIGTSTATLTQVLVGIDQSPTISETDISVTLV